MRVYRCLDARGVRYFHVVLGAKWFDVYVPRIGSVRVPPTRDPSLFARLLHAFGARE